MRDVVWLSGTDVLKSWQALSEAVSNTRLKMRKWCMVLNSIGVGDICACQFNLSIFMFEQWFVLKAIESPSLQWRIKVHNCDLRVEH